MRTAGVREWLLDLLFPRACLQCRAEGALLCRSCRAGITPIGPACPACGSRRLDARLCPSCYKQWRIQRFIAPFAYRDPLARTLIHSFKYDRVQDLAPLLADEVMRWLARYHISLPKDAVFVPIPLHPNRERERGFNQAELFGRALSRASGIPLRPLLRRTRGTPPQSSLESHAARQANVADAFGIGDPRVSVPQKIILLDDVATSGATLREAARTLRAHGARTIWAVVIAKG
ncbi:ComF family protein [Candidatus Parcubacteria bacterium]|nr:MAG: ComF family protein [Candidatus Parcubacteria bacterium]